MIYIKETRAKIDRCNICGRIRELTWDHVPPQSSLLKPNVYASTIFGKIPTNESHMRRYQSGIKYRSICRECNNMLSRYDIVYKKFHTDVISQLTIPNAEDTFFINVQIYP